jgi:nitrite reductase/ring-hydroxylating ferredoxin subunit
MSSKGKTSPNWARVATWSGLENRKPAYGLLGNGDFVAVRYDDQVSVLYGHCQHRDALIDDGFVESDNLICGVHRWDYRVDTGVSEYNDKERLQKFPAKIDVEQDAVLVDAQEVSE